MKRAHPNLTRVERDNSTTPPDAPQHPSSLYPFAGTLLFLLAGWLHNAPLAYVGALICVLAVDWLSINNFLAKRVLSTTINKWT